MFPVDARQLGWRRALVRWRNRLVYNLRFATRRTSRALAGRARIGRCGLQRRLGHLCCERGRALSLRVVVLQLIHSQEVTQLGGGVVPTRNVVYDSLPQLAIRTLRGRQDVLRVIRGRAGTLVPVRPRQLPLQHVGHLRCTSASSFSRCACRSSEGSRARHPQPSACLRLQIPREVAVEAWSSLNLTRLHPALCLAACWL
mmetsp:Transcript_29688/g.78759  ORF Transcript_29688/g.78759 Transcript_29688/m.78759 type:complete len:200 (+) Transcript_29688:1059-1658(+)